MTLHLPPVVAAALAAARHRLSALDLSASARPDIVAQADKWREAAARGRRRIEEINEETSRQPGSAEAAAATADKLISGETTITKSRSALLDEREELIGAVADLDRRIAGAESILSTARRDAVRRIAAIVDEELVPAIEAAARPLTASLATLYAIARATENATEGVGVRSVYTVLQDALAPLHVAAATKKATLAETEALPVAEAVADALAPVAGFIAEAGNYLPGTIPFPTTGARRPVT